MSSQTVDPKYNWVVILFVALVLLVLFMVTSCRRAVVPATADTVYRSEIRTVVRDTTIYLTDSSGISALIECDSLGRARVKAIQDYYAGQFIKPKVVIRDNIIKLTADIDSAKVYVHWKETHTKESQKVTQPIRINYVTGWQYFQIYIGRILGTLLILFIAYLFARRYVTL